MSNRTGAGHVAISMVAIFLVGAPAAAQPRLSSGSEKSIAALTVVGLTTIQPADNTYVGADGPYLDRGLGGLGFGAAAGLNVLTPSRFAATLEVSTASVSVSQRGRLVGGSVPRTTRIVQIGVGRQIVRAGVGVRVRLD